MRLTHKLLLACVAAIAALAFGATNASAIEPVEVVDEATGNHCTVAAPCMATAEGESEIHTEFLGIEVSNCEDTFTASITENGTGTISHHGEDHPVFTNPSCTREACDQTAPHTNEWPHPWVIHSAEETAPNEGLMGVEFCLEETANEDTEGRNCEATVHVEETGTHDYTFTTNQHCETQGQPAVRVSGTWTATDSGIEIEHDQL